MTETPVLQATINGVTVESHTPGDLRAAAVQELLRQEAVAEGLLEPSASDDATAEALEALLEKHVSVPSPDEAELGRYFDAHRTRYSNGELVFASHILLQMTPGTPVAALLARAESLLHQVQANPARFEQIARENSNCPSAELGGSIGQVQRGDTVPEFESALFADGSVGLWPSIVRTRYGFHIVRIDRREAGRQLPFEAARERVAQDLQRQTLAQALQQYVRIVAGRSDIQGVDLDGASSPLIN
ncbi:peptidylprolyl isomerase [Uliginosibacterium sp. sgz301328]|uniref:peptidylprolyl isomerase n=1 Tax=Uliginosibacterium sp. sgz301328 TaxID=3243764 RepID=UPI00359EEDC3